MLPSPAGAGSRTRAGSRGTGPRRADEVVIAADPDPVAAAHQRPPGQEPPKQYTIIYKSSEKHQPFGVEWSPKGDGGATAVGLAPRALASGTVVTGTVVSVGSSGPKTLRTSSPPSS